MKNLLGVLLFIPLMTYAQWSQLGDDIDGQAVNDQSGHSSALSADGFTLIVGEWRNSTVVENSGQIRVFDWDGANWNQKGEAINGEGEGDIFGEDVAINATGDIIVAGAPSFFDPDYLTGTAAEGYANVYQWDGTAWMQLGSTIFGEAFDDTSGVAVSMNAAGDIIAIGASSNGDSFTGAGHTRIFQWDGTTWNQLGQDIDGEGENAFSGGDLSLDATGTTVVIGEPGQDTNGQVRVFEWDGTNWNQKGSAISGDDLNSSYGSTVAIDAGGDTVVVGSFSFENGALGSVQVFDWNGTDWEQKGTTIFGSEGSDFLGTSIAINNTGNIIGAGAVTGGVGYARIFNFTDTEWEQVGEDIVGDADGSQFGRSLSMNESGAIVAIGTPFNMANGNASGHVRVLENATLTIPENVLFSTALSPNPTLRQLTITANQLIQEIGIYNILGQKVAAYVVNATQTTLETSNLPSGVYVAQIKSERTQENLRFIKK